ncbi:MAG: hypothetical protein HQ522_16635 [Bacteroidetes bacterium]|nr:hypothetical protein [Bacteroidota bacterium]
MRINLKLPKGWHEVDGINLVKLAKLFLKYQEKPDFLTRCFFLFSGWKILKHRELQENGKRYYWFKLHKGKPFFVDVDVFHSLVKELEWILENIKLPAGNPSIKYYKACNYKLYNVTLEEFLEADNFYNAFVTTGEAKFLNQLFGVFYKKKVDIVLYWVSKYEKYAVFLWFSGVKNSLVNKYPYLFSGSSGSTTTSSPEESILNLLSSLNNGDVTNNEKLFKTHVHECFHELNMKIEHAPKN